MDKNSANHSPQVIGVDLGGTAIKLGRFDAAGRCLHSLTIPTPQPAEPHAVVEAIAAAIRTLDPDDQALAIGIGTPGPVDETGRLALVAINLGWKDVPIADWLEERTGKPVVAANDANCAGIGEVWLGAGRQYRDAILLTLGTGVGGAVILNGKLFTGRHGTAAELGLITLDPSGDTCNSGNHGSLEQLVSVQAIRRRTGMEPAELGQRAAAGDETAIAFWKNYGCDLGAGISNLIYIFTPEVVILGGGVSASAPFFMPTLWDEINQRVLETSREGLQIVTAELGNQAGMVGAAKLAWEKLESITPKNADEAKNPLLSDADLAYHMAQETARFNAGFLARTAHELRSPLNGILGLHQLILGDLCDSPEEERGFVKQAHDSGMKMLALLDEVIRISKFSTGSLPLQMQPVQLSGLLKTVHEINELHARDRNVRLDIQLPDPQVYVQADPNWLRQVLVHRLESAISHMDGGSIKLGVTVSPHQQAQIWVEDSRPAEAWKDSLDWMQQDRIPLTAQPNRDQLLQAPSSLSPGQLLQMDYLVLQRMGSRLEWQVANTESGQIRLTFGLPLAVI
ncbi:ROK family protein [Leptolyngbya sp. FACHB-16]|nr:ROK family protein [Leptolyngbya sp. FACHB-8]MBD2156893.1 ROK family protein [Leptolyngbya sp. FACHB-16]